MDDRQAALAAQAHKRLLALKLLPRTGWLQRGLSPVESVAEHTFGVATLALIVGDLHEELDQGHLLAIALLHDMAEALIGDIPTSARRFLPAGVKQAAEGQALYDIFCGLPQVEAYVELWKEYAEGSTPEARLVKQLDRLELLFQAQVYEKNGHRGLDEFWADADQGWGDEFPLVRELAELLLEQRG